MNRDKLEAFLIGFGAGVLVGVFMKLGKHPAEAVDDGRKPLSFVPPT